MRQNRKQLKLTQRTVTPARIVAPTRLMTSQLPIYLVTYRYSGKVYQVMINGQTEIMAESKPVGWMKMQKGIKP